jgi:hypothetical protein
VDFWETIDRGIATTAFSGATFIGPIAVRVLESLGTGSRRYGRRSDIFTETNERSMKWEPVTPYIHGSPLTSSALSHLYCLGQHPRALTIAGPIVGEFIIKSYLGWRCTAWITLIMAAFIGILGLLTVPETFAPVLLKRKAEKLRHETKNWALPLSVGIT